MNSFFSAFNSLQIIFGALWLILCVVFVAVSFSLSSDWHSFAATKTLSRNVLAIYFLCSVFFFAASAYLIFIL
jgi:hypothetical protein